ncbi:MAG: hypothetical protein A3J65_03120 [Candidatus Buchananbacteria bacterium RIFCSPHIGHO2_02_FULL_45_11b]|uniref:Phosphomannomutase/phosphoglucomutase n=3 Tax=Candidatus Buchananiibacteriota TaxID=1817903 RepID=A0A1G1YEY6_9BACT|nr:MAG: hypothetical protein A2663_04670 [Candidatus Buchananbacteria bacterium RIFCSPHIGHO2_01_FULL_46_12]OGY50918.1 MAG: hypothetical protein A3J65_03120 [Candidatus Buchananbacteria bacterium RIFCSPHIGHO2_02_FULL_45_11b]OGY54148.1 MAG: hypothetical protein A3B15_01210 [Candidatus Buchananbacteria bacterium RIFCSPLOWO2_01_FULL_45_31]
MGNINPKIFKSYDIRGIYPAELNEEAAYLIGRAFARKAKAKAIVVGSDMRLSGPVLKEKLIAGITDEGADAIDIGLVAIDTVYFAVGILKYEAGIMITASHNPKEYNGFKMALKDMVWVRGEELKEDVLKLSNQAISDQRSGDQSDKISNIKGKIIQKDILPDYIKHVLSFCDSKKIKPLKVAVDAGNGMAGKIMPLLQTHLPIKVIPLNFTLDGNFPSHPSNPLLPESQVQIAEEIKKQKADLGVIFDGDTDRLIFADETGRAHQADYTLLILAREFLNREPGTGIAYNAICSKSIPDIVTEWGGRPIRTKVGYVNVSAAMRENNCVVGGEVSAHYCFRDNGYSDSGFIAFVILLQLLSEDSRPFSEIVKPFYRYLKAPEQNFVFEKREDIEKIIAAVKKHYSAGKQDELDGLTVWQENWWFNIRPSNTEPLLRLTIEAGNDKLLAEKNKELVDFIESGTK